MSALLAMIRSRIAELQAAQALEPRHVRLGTVDGGPDAQFEIERLRATALAAGRLRGNDCVLVYVVIDPLLQPEEERRIEQLQPVLAQSPRSNSANATIPIVPRRRLRPARTTNPNQWLGG